MNKKREKNEIFHLVRFEVAITIYYRKIKKNDTYKYKHFCLSFYKESMTELSMTEEEQPLSFFEKVQSNLMTYFPKPTYTMFCYISNTPLFSQMECNQMVHLGNQLPLEYQKLTNTNAIDTDNFRVKTNYFTFGQHTIVDDFYHRIKETIIKANHEIWSFQLYDFGEPLKFMEYDSQYNSFVKTHCDLSHIGVTKYRKLTVVVQLTDETEYEGGELVVQHYEHEYVMPKKIGTVILFPSFLLHRVQPVTKGKRHSLVTFAFGPPFC